MHGDREVRDRDSVWCVVLVRGGRRLRKERKKGEKRDRQGVSEKGRQKKERRETD